MSATTTVPNVGKLLALYEAGEYPRALRLVDAEPVSASTDQPDDLDSADTALLVANLYRETARYADAEPYYLQALGGLAAAGKDRAAYARALADLAELYEKLDRHQRAEELYVAARLAHQATADPDPVGHARCLSRLAGLLDADGRRGEAVACLREARTRLESGRAAPLAFADLLIAEAQVLSRTEGVATAAVRLREAVELRRRHSGDGHPEMAGARLLLGGALLALNQTDDAAKLIDPARERLTAILGPNHPRAVAGLEAVAMLRLAQGAAHEAEPLARKALAAYRETLGDGHSWTGEAHSTLAQVLLADQRLVAAEESLEAALSVYRDVFGPRHPLVAGLRIDLAELRAAAGRPREAAELAREAVADLDAFAELRLERAGGWLVVARLAAEAGEVAEAETAANRVVALAAECGNEPNVRVPALLLLYRLAIGRRDVTAGVAHLTTAEAALGKLPPGHPLHQEVAATRAGLDWMQGDPRRAITRARDAVRDAGNGRGLPWALGFLAEQFLQAGELADAEAAYERALSIQQRQSGPSHPSTAATLRGLARLHSARGNPAAAEVRVRKALDILRDALGDDHPDTADALADLALHAHQAGDLVAAEGMYRKVVEVRREALGDTHPQTAAGLHGLATVLSARGDSAAAVTTLEEAITPLEETHPERSPLRHTLGLVLHGRGESGRAMELFALVLRDYEAILGELHDGLVPVLADLANVHAGLGDHLEARRILGRIRRILAASPLPQPMEEARLLTALSDSHLRMADPARGGALAEEALRLARAAVPPGDPMLLSVLIHSAVACGAERRYGRATALLAETEGIVRRAGGEGHPFLAGVWLERAALEAARGRTRSATTLFERAADLARTSLGEDHPDHAAARRRLAEHLQSVGRHADAARHLRTYREAVRRTVGADHPAVAVAILAAVDAHRQAGDLAAAEESCREALAVLRRSDIPADALMANALHALGVVLRLRGRLPDAAAAFGQALEIDRESPGGGDHGGGMDTRRELAWVEAAQGEDASALARLQQVLTAQEDLLSGCASLPPGPARDGLFDGMVRTFEQLLTLAIRTGTVEVAGAGLRWIAISPAELLPDGRGELRRRHPADADAIDRLFDLNLQIARRRLAGAGLEGLALHRELLSRWEADRDAVEGTLAQRIPTLARLRAWRGVNEESVRAALPAGATFVELVRFQPAEFTEVCAGRDGRAPARYAAVVSQESGTVLLDIAPAAVLEGKDGAAVLRSVVLERLKDCPRVIVGHGGLSREVWCELASDVVGTRSVRDLAFPSLAPAWKGLLARVGGWLVATWRRGFRRQSRPVG